MSAPKGIEISPVTNDSQRDDQLVEKQIQEKLKQSGIVDRSK